MICDCCGLWCFVRMCVVCWVFVWLSVFVCCDWWVFVRCVFVSVVVCGVMGLVWFDFWCVLVVWCGLVWFDLVWEVVWSYIVCVWWVECVEINGLVVVLLFVVNVLVYVLRMIEFVRGVEFVAVSFYVEFVRFAVGMVWEDLGGY